MTAIAAGVTLGIFGALLGAALLLAALQIDDGRHNLLGTR